MGSLLPSRSLARASFGLLLIVSPFLPGACGGSTTITFVGSSGGSGGTDGEGGEGGEGGDIGGAGGGSGGAETGGNGTGAGDSGGTGGVILASCGNGDTEDGEACDDGGEDTAECDFDCTLAECGDDYTNDAAREACDDGGESDSCDDDCTAPDCGDGVVNETTGEECDDDNNVDGDGCTAECVREILILGDGFSEGDAVELLRSAGFAVTLAPVLEYEYDGTNPAPDEFCGVIQFDATYTQPMTVEGQTALVDYVEAGGGFMSTGGTALEASTFDLGAMSDLILLTYAVSTEGTYALTTPGTTHPITAGLPASFVHNAGGEAGACKAGSTALLTDYVNEALCVNDEIGDGRAISFGNTFGFFGARPLLAIEMGTLLINAANWLCGTNHSFPKLTPGSTEIYSRFGFRAQCQEWDGDICRMPWIGMDPAAIDAPECIDDVTSMRPMWWSYIQPEANTWCWIAAGTIEGAVGTPEEYDPSNPYGTTEYYGGWMYTSSDAICDLTAVRHYSTVDIPVVGSQVWSFDDLTYMRDGDSLDITCAW